MSDYVKVAISDRTSERTIEETSERRSERVNCCFPSIDRLSAVQATDDGWLGLMSCERFG